MFRRGNAKTSFYCSSGSTETLPSSRSPNAQTCRSSREKAPADPQKMSQTGVRTAIDGPPVPKVLSEFLPADDRQKSLHNDFAVQRQRTVFQVMDVHVQAVYHL